MNKADDVDDHTTHSMPPTTTIPPLYLQPSTSNVNSYKAELISLLGIPSHLTGSGDVLLQIAYQKYNAFLVACQTLDQMLANNSWMIKRPTQTDLIELFVSKSFYHSHYKRFFSQVAQYSDMVAWLESQPDRMSDVDIWGILKANYTFTDLKA